MGYSVWVQRSPSAGVLIPPDPPGTATYPVIGTELIRGPDRQGDLAFNSAGIPIAQTNPVMSDDLVLLATAVPDPTTFDIRTSPVTDYYPDWTGHVLRGRLDSVNECFIDGHVERLATSTLKIRYKANAWNCW